MQNEKELFFSLDHLRTTGEISVKLYEHLREQGYRSLFDLVTSQVEKVIQDLGTTDGLLKEVLELVRFVGLRFDMSDDEVQSALKFAKLCRRMVAVDTLVVMTENS